MGPLKIKIIIEYFKLMENRRELLWKDLTTAEIEEHIFKHYNYDGQAMHNDLLLLERHDRAKQLGRKTMPLWLGMSAVSAFNLSRFGVLSSTGKGAAVAGMIGGIYFVTCAYNS